MKINLEKVSWVWLVFFVAVFFSTGIVHATTVGNDISTGGSLTVFGTTNIGSGTFFVDPNNRWVGIGTTNPTQALEVNGTIKANDIISKGPEVDVRNYASINAAVAAIGSTQTTLLIPNAQTLTANLVVPSNLSLHILNGGSIVKASNFTLTINGLFEAGLYQVFSGFVAGDVIGFSLNREIYSEWWGAKANNSTDCTVALQSAASSLIDGGKIKLSSGTYRFVNLSLSNAGISLEGNDWDTILMSTTNPGSSINTTSLISVQANNCTLHNFKLTWATMPTDLALTGIWITQNNGIGVGWWQITEGQTLIENTTIDHVYVLGGKTHGIALGRTDNTVIEQSRVEGVWGTGIWGTYATNVKINSNYIYNTADAGIDMTANGSDDFGPEDFSKNVTIEGNTVKNAIIGIGLHGVYNGVVNANTIDNTWGQAIVASSDLLGGHVAPHSILITNNILSKIFQFYGSGQYHVNDAFTEVGGRRSAIEAYVVDAVIISGNNISDDSGLSLGQYGSIWANGEKVTIDGNTIKQDWPFGIFLGKYGIPSDYSDINSLTVTGNNITITSGHGSVMLGMFGVSGGTVSGNYFDCGGQSLSSPAGRFVLTQWAKDVLITGNRVLNFTDEYSTNGNSSGIDLFNNTGLMTYGANLFHISMTNGYVGIGTTNPDAKLQVFGGDAVASTVEIGGEGSTRGACLKLRDSDGAGWTYCTTLDGALSCSQVSCE